MDKDKLIETLISSKDNEYNWNLYFFKIDRRNSNPYIAYKIRFKNDQYIIEYAKTLVDMVVKYQLKKLKKLRIILEKIQRFLVIDLKQVMNWSRGSGTILLMIL